MVRYRKSIRHQNSYGKVLVCYYVSICAMAATFMISLCYAMMITMMCLNIKRCDSSVTRRKIIRKVVLRLSFL